MTDLPTKDRKCGLDCQLHYDQPSRPAKSVLARFTMNA